MAAMTPGLLSLIALAVSFAGAVIKAVMGKHKQNAELKAELAKANAIHSGNAMDERRELFDDYRRQTIELRNESRGMAQEIERLRQVTLAQDMKITELTAQLQHALLRASYAEAKAGQLFDLNNVYRSEIAYHRGQAQKVSAPAPSEATTGDLSQPSRIASRSIPPKR